MGANSSQDKRTPVRGGIHIQISKTGFVSGETIQGIISISLEENFQGHILQVGLEGTEESHYRYSATGSETKQNIVAKGKNKFLDFQTPLYDFAQGAGSNNFTLQPGQWQIPFQLVIAEALPTSVSIIKSDEIYGFLKYKVTAQIISLSPNIRPVYGEQEICVAQRMNLPPVEKIEQKALQPRTCCCCGPDPFQISVSTDKQSYVPGETVRATINSDLSKYGKNVENMKVQFEGLLILNSKVNQPKGFQIFSIEKKIQVQNKQVREQVQFQIPQNLNLSSEGNFVKLSYGIKVNPEVSSCCKWGMESEKDYCRVSVFINPQNQNFNFNQTPQLLNVQAPNMWNPMQIQPQQFSQQQASYIQQQQANNNKYIIPE